MKSQEKRLFDNNQGSHYPQRERKPSIRLKNHLTFSTIETFDVKEPFNVSKTLHHRGWKNAMEEEWSLYAKTRHGYLLIYIKESLQS
jgi:hypothetical protein